MPLVIRDDVELWAGWERIAYEQILPSNRRAIQRVLDGSLPALDRLLIWAWYQLPFLRRFLRPRLERAVFGEIK